MTAPEGVRTTLPREGSSPSPRDPVSARATIGSLAESRRSEIEKRMVALTEEYRRLALELVAMQGAAAFVGIITEEGAE